MDLDDGANFVSKESRQRKSQYKYLKCSIPYTIRAVLLIIDKTESCLSIKNQSLTVSLEMRLPSNLKYAITQSEFIPFRGFLCCVSVNLLYPTNLFQY